MHVELVNASTQAINRLLTIGHPRLQGVSLRDGLQVSRRDSGINAPLTNNPLPMAGPAFDLRFEPGEHENLWLRVSIAAVVNTNFFEFIDSIRSSN